MTLHQLVRKFYTVLTFEAVGRATWICALRDVRYGDTMRIPRGIGKTPNKALRDLARNIRGASLYRYMQTGDGDIGLVVPATFRLPR